MPARISHVVLVGCCLALGTAQAQAPDPQLIDDLAAANRILFDQGVVDGFGHISARHDKDPGRFLLSRNMAPALVTAADILEYDVDSKPIDPQGRGVYLERFIHGEIYRARPDVKAIVHSHSPGVIPFSVTPVGLKPIYHMAAFLAVGVPVFEIRNTAGGAGDLLVSSNALGRALAATLADKPVVLMRGHGSVAVGNSVRQVVFRAVYTETNARLQAEALKLGPVTYLSEAEAAKMAPALDGQLARPWELWKRKALGQ
ncbi:MAG: class II aldolase/adducin family protein [Proteobacteria bacterium]|nr:class II aldolase/adducin family protein [Pseudomonadota bacterium]